MRAGLCVTVVLAAILALGSACDFGRGTVASKPGETPEELDAAGEVLGAVGDSVAVVEIQLASHTGNEQRRTVGVVIGDRRRILLDATPLSLEMREGEQMQTAHTRSIEVVFHPGGDEERRVHAEIVRRSNDHDLALLAVDSEAGPALPLSDDVPDGVRAFLIALPMNMSRLVVEPGEIRGYHQTTEGRFLRHTAGHDENVTGPIIDGEGELLGLQISDAPQERMALPAVEIARWLQTPDPDEMAPSEPGQVISRLLRQADVPHSATEAGEGYLVRRPDGTNLTVRQIEGVISVEVDLGTLHVGDGIQGLRSNYSDPLGAVALKPAGDSGQLVWVAKLPADATTAPYLSDAMRMAVLQVQRWSQLQAGLDPDYPYDHYPGGDEAVHEQRLAEIVTETGLVHEQSDDYLKLQPDAAVPVFTNVFRGMAYVYAYSGGMPGAGASEREQIARELLRRNWDLPLGRLALDKHFDLAWEAQVPMDYLTATHLQALVRVCQTEVARLEAEYGDIPFNEQ
ncbi:MAG: hypothetical protein GF393_04425 [Armatimonadia bacterium]|nr:hypothetical protein [Armatimonadia bacterium]